MRPSVELVVRPWVGDHDADEGDPDSVVFIDEILIDGEHVLPERDWSKVTLHAEAGNFLSVRIENPPQALLDRYPVEDRLREGELPATPDMLLLPIGAITTRSRVPT